MVCEGLTFKSDGIDVTELSPVCLGGRVIYAASFDPALEPQRLSAAAQPVVEAPEPVLAPTGSRFPSNSPETRLFVFGIAAGVIAAMALGQHKSVP
jgi:hypothetical protein